MIKIDGYGQNDETIEGIVITWGDEWIERKGGLRKFLKEFYKSMNDEDGTWFQYTKSVPRRDFIYVYIVYKGRVRYRQNFVGIETNRGFKFLVTTGPLKRPRQKMVLKGAPYFRYCQKLF